MDLLAQTANFQQSILLLQTEIQSLKDENHSLQNDLETLQDCYQRAESEAGLELDIKKQPGETIEDFKKRKKTIYYKRFYKRRKNESPKEENRSLIAELESLRGQLFETTEKCEQLSEDNSFHVDRLPKETEDDFKKRRQAIYNHRSYARRKKMMKIQKGLPEQRRPCSVARLPADNPSMTGLEIVLRKYIKTHPRSWPNVFQKSQDVRLLNVSYWINDSGLIKENSLKRSVTMEIPRAGERDSATIMPSFEIQRHFAIQFLDPNTKEWCNLFSIKPSSLVRSQGLRPKAGYGLFAARPFKSGDRIGIYLGEIFEADKFPAKKRTHYSLIFNVDKTSAPKRLKFASRIKSFISDPGYCPSGSTDNMKRPPVYFGIHYVNDPRWEPDGTQQPNRVTRNTCPAYNIEIGEDLVVTTIADVEEGEELFTDYTAGSGRML
jgi:hypothetical protein